MLLVWDTPAHTSHSKFHMLHDSDTHTKVLHKGHILHSMASIFFYPQIII